LGKIRRTFGVAAIKGHMGATERRQRMTLHLLEELIRLVEPALPTTKLRQAGHAVGHRQRPARREVLHRTGELLFSLSPRAPPRQHTPVVGPTLAKELLDPQPCGHLLHSAAPLRLTLVVADPLAGVAFLRAAAGHRLFPAFWLAAATGMRRSELLGLRWNDIDLSRGIVSINRGLIAVAYELHETRGKTRNARRPINVDTITVEILGAWHTWQHTEQRVVGIDDHGWVFTDTSGQPVHPHAISQAFERIVIRAGLHDVRHAHATLLAQAGVHPKVVSERLGHANAKFTIETYQHVMPSMQADAVAVIEGLMGPPRDALLPATASTGSTRLK
jgi:hypothetical protein